MQHFTGFFPKFKSGLLVKIAAFLLNAALVLEILDLISRMDVTEGFGVGVGVYNFKLHDFLQSILGRFCHAG
jgi:hypothetical protein